MDEVECVDRIGEIRSHNYHISFDGFTVCVCVCVPAQCPGVVDECVNVVSTSTTHVGSCLYTPSRCEASLVLLAWDLGGRQGRVGELITASYMMCPQRFKLVALKCVPKSLILFLFLFTLSGRKSSGQLAFVNIGRLACSAVLLPPLVLYPAHHSLSHFIEGGGCGYVVVCV